MVRADLDGNSGKPGLKKPGPVTVPVNGRKLQTLRQLAGLTQEQLAQKSGYSDRLVRKAEASSPLRKSTIANLAAALSTSEIRVTVADLVFSHELISTDIAEFLLHGPLTSKTSFKDLIDPLFAIRVAGQELNIPFAGIHSGPAACESFRDQFRRSCVEIQYQPHQTRCFSVAGETCVQAMTQLQLSSPSLEQPPSVEIWWFMQIRFEASRVINMDLYYDTGNICRMLECW